jgi:hypothetical protein
MAFTSSGDPRATGLPDWPRHKAEGKALAGRAGGRSEVITDAQPITRFPRLQVGSAECGDLMAQDEEFDVLG